MRTSSALQKAATALLLAATASAVDLRPFNYREGFESGVPQVTLWAKNGTSTVNAIEASTEQAFEGTRSLKLDVTLNGGSYHYWGVALRVPCEGELKLSARVLVGKETTARVGFGTNMVYPPTHHSGCGPIKSFTGPTDGWQLVEEDLVERGRDGRDSVLQRYTTTVTGKEAGSVLDRWAIFVYGGEGKRAVVYIDDVRIEGRVPDETAYVAETQQRFDAAREAFRNQVAEWRAEWEESRQLMSRLPPPQDALRQSVEAIKTTAARAEELLDTFAKAGYASSDQISEFKAALVAVRHGPATLKTIAERVAQGTPFVVFAPEPVISDRRVAAGLPLASVPAEELACSAAGGEYESVCATVFAVQDLDSVLVRVGPLQGPAGRIPADRVDVSIIKWWYQGAGGIGYSPKKVLVPELLLKDDQLVRVDQDAEDNYLRSTAEDGAETYLLCSGQTSDELADVRPVDARALRPVDIAANTLREYWITVRVPENTPGGTYKGEVSFSCRQGTSTVPLRVDVHPFELAPSRLRYSIYYRAKLSPDGKPTIGSELKSEEQYRAEIEDMKAHGVVFPSNYQGWHDDLLPRVLEIRREVGMPPGPFYNLGQSTGSTSDPEQLKALQARVKRWTELCRSFGYDDIYFYGIDEAKGDRLQSQRLTWKAVQDAGGKTFVACYKKTFEAMGSLLNCAVLAGPPDPEEAAKWHGVGSQAFCYANPQVGVERPAVYRRNFGLLLWKAGFDGAMDYAYQHGFHHVWNDFDDKRYRDHNFTYPTMTGVVGTLAWEGFREGVDDVRYVTTLEKAIESAPAGKAEAAARARAWLKELDPKTADLDEARAKMAELIRELI